MVSTDSEEIAEISRQCGASVPFFRSEENSNDYAITADVINEVINEYEKLGKKFDTLCCIYPTAPFVTAKKLLDAYNEMKKSSADSAMTVVRYGFPPQRAVVIRNGKIEFQYPEYYKTRSQDLEPIYHDCGQFYFCNIDAFKKYNTMITPNCVPFVVSEEVQDIDNISDWNIAEMKYNASKKRES